MPANTELSHHILASQTNWRNTDRNWISQPVELEQLGNLLDQQFKTVFSTYIDSDRPPVIIGYAGLINDVDTPKYRASISIPDEVSPENSEAYATGIHDLNEWMTNTAVQYFFERLYVGNRFGPLNKPLKKVLGVPTHILARLSRGTNCFPVMSMLERSAKQAKLTKESYQDILLSAFFKHDFSKFNALISFASPTLLERYSEQLETITDLAIQIGKHDSLHVFDQISQLAIVDDAESNTARWVKRVLISVLIGGNQVQPGVVEVNTGYHALTTAIAASLYLSMANGLYAKNPSFIEALSWGGTFSTSIFLTFSPLIVAHEALHDYSSDKRFIGFIPVQYE